jgi:hypothetical protein
MKVECEKHRITIVAETPEDEDKINDALDGVKDVMLYFTYDAGSNGRDFGLVITSRSQ